MNLMLHAGAAYVGRQDLLALPVPEPTETHKPVPHAEVVRAVVESLDLRNISVVRDEYAVSPDAMRMFGVMEIDVDYSGVRLALGLRNSHDKSFSLGVTAGYRVFVCDNLAFSGDFTPVSRKHTRNFDHVEVIDNAVTRMQRCFDPMKRRIDAFQAHQLPDASARDIIYRAFIADELDAPKHLARSVHHHYFEPELPEFEPRTLWSLENAFTSALKVLEPVPQMRVTGDLARFMGQFQ